MTGKIGGNEAPDLKQAKKEVAMEPKDPRVVRFSRY
jgi:hypothetical protein